MGFNSAYEKAYYLSSPAVGKAVLIACRSTSCWGSKRGCIAASKSCCTLLPRVLTLYLSSCSALSNSHLTGRNVECNAMRPAGKFRLVPKPVQRRMGFDKRLLGQILSQVSDSGKSRVSWRYLRSSSIRAA